MIENTLSKQVQASVFPLSRVVLAISVVILMIAALLVGIRWVQAADPYIHNVLTLQGSQQRGQAIFQMNCAVCHGIGATGEVGPSLLEVSSRKSKVNLIKQVVSGATPPMPQFQPDPQDMADLLSYLEAL